ncbi:hypothetical protein CEXT_526721, partial [Caerostris extrusa]
RNLANEVANSIAKNGSEDQQQQARETPRDL